jgi:hypothetical protein
MGISQPGANVTTMLFYVKRASSAVSARRRRGKTNESGVQESCTRVLLLQPDGLSDPVNEVHTISRHNYSI